MQARVASMEDMKEARLAALAQGRFFPMGMLKVFIGFLLFGVGLSAVGMYMARHTLAAAAPSLFRPCLGASASGGAEEELEGLEHWTRPQARPRHAMTDEELLWRASFAPRVRQYPFPRVPKVAFMFLTRGPLPLAPLWERFFRGHEGRYSIYVHALPSYRGNFTSDSVFYNRHVASKPPGKLMDTIRRPVTAASSLHQSAANHLQPLVTLAQRNGVSRRCLLTLLASATAIPEASESRQALLQDYVKRSKENEEKNDKEMLDDFYKRNYKDNFGFIEGSVREKKEELTESEKGILAWLGKNK